jgi:sulfate transport system substrate-binding protein
MTGKLGVLAAGFLVVAGVAWFTVQGGEKADHDLLNVSYDPTRELWRDLNEQFLAGYQAETGQRVRIRQSHGGSSSQARAVLDGLNADVVTLALWSDTDAIRKQGLIQDGWEERLPHHSLPYHSTLVFVVRKGNPRGIKDWPDLLRDGVEVITPNPKTSGNGKLSFLAAWGAVRHRGGSDREALEYVTQLYRRVPVLDSGARGATTTFAQKGIGDVHITWENEAHLEVEESKGELEVIYPPVSIRAEPYVALVDANVDRKNNRAAAEAYLRFLYTEAAQETLARHYYRPSDPTVAKRHEKRLPAIELFSITSFVPGGWGEADRKFFASDAIFDQLYQSGR